MTACPSASRIERTRALKLLFRPGDIVELRVPKTVRDGTVSGYFNNFDALMESAIEQDRKRAPAVYVTLNEVDPVLLSRAVNRAKSRAAVTTSDDNINRRKWFLIDADPERAAGISSNDAEHLAALERVRAIRKCLAGEGWPEPILADSGNGGHLLYPVDLPNDATTTVMINRCLRAIKERWSDEVVGIDTTVGNAARITKLYGTVARKGDHTDLRPHRLSSILEAPEAITVVRLELLMTTAAKCPQPVRTPRSASGKAGGEFQLVAWIARHGLNVKRGPVEWEGHGDKWELEVCPFNPEHTGGCAVITRGHDNGALGFKCHHNYELRQLLDPQEVRGFEIRDDGVYHVANGAEGRLPGSS